MKSKLDEVFGLLQEFDTVWSKMTPVQQQVVYRGAFNFLKVEGTKWSRRFRVEDFSLKSIFESWYHGRAWNDSLLLTEQELGIVTDKQDSELCQSYGFAPTDGRCSGIPGRYENQSAEAWTLFCLHGAMWRWHLLHWLNGKYRSTSEAP